MNIFKKLLVGSSALVAALVGILLSWGLAEPYFLDEEAHVAVLPTLPPAWEGQRFALLADWQIGMWLDNEPTIRRAVGRLAEEQPAFVLVAGDFVYHTAAGDQAEVEKAARLLRPLVEAGVPIYAVLGNHDYGMQKPDGTVDEALAKRVTEALEAAGVHVLENEAAALSAPSETSSSTRVDTNGGAVLYVVGVAPSWPGRAAPQQALAQVPSGAPRLVLMHNPEAFARFPAGTAPVALAGHTHGGQVQVPLLPQSTWMSYFKSDPVHADGWIEEGFGEASNRLYVNRGIGFSLAPLRIGAPPELTRFVLQAR